MEYSPPPLFKQGASARVKVVFFSLAAIMLLVIDARFQALNMVRQGVGSVLYPLQMLALVPRDAVHNMGDYFTRLTTLERENASLRRSQLTQAVLAQQGQQLQYENAQLRRLLATGQQVAVKSVMAEILYDARDNFNRRVILSRGLNHGIALGQPVIDDKGVVGQVTRVFPLTSEVTLLTDKDQAIPVQVQRNGLRSVIYGKGQVGSLELRVPSNADIKVGDILVTSGIDGIYPAGLFVARAAVVENNATSTFERIACLPIAGLDRHKEVLVLLVDTHIESRPLNDESKPKKINRRVTRDNIDSGVIKAKEVAKEPVPETGKNPDKNANLNANPNPNPNPHATLTTEKVLDKGSGKATDKVTNTVAAKGAGKVSGKVAEKVSGNVAGKAPDKVFAKTADKVAGRAPDKEKSKEARP